MTEAFLYEALRTPRGKGKPSGALHGVKPISLITGLIDELRSRHPNLDPARIDDIVLGVVSPVGDQGADIPRAAALAAGLPDTVAGLQINRFCASGLEAVNLGAMKVRSGWEDLVLTGGVESMSRVPMGASFAGGQFGAPYGPLVAERYDGFAFNQGVGAEMIAAEFGLTRAELDQHALDSHARAARAIDEGRFKGQTTPVTVTDAEGTTRVFDTDEGVRRGGTLEALGALKTPFKADGVVSAGNASQISDGSAALLITTSEIAAANGWTPIARFHTGVVTGADPITMLKGPIPATKKVLARAGLTLADIGAFEINEAFASVTLGWQRATGADYALLNPNGGAMALGHPLGGSGARLMTTLVHHMRDQGIRYGLQAMCEGGGTANATVLELL